jgi:short-subunit dehydrogenase
VPTEVQARAGFTDDPNSGVLTQSAARVADIGYQALRQGQRVAVPGLMNRLTVAAMRLVPRGLLLASVGRYNRSRGDF